MSSPFLISPAEPKFFKTALDATSASVCEKYGSDFMFGTRIDDKDILVGIQRKEFPGDFLSSLADGRLKRECIQLEALPLRILLVEGRARWSITNILHHERQRVEREYVDATLHSMQFFHGVHVFWTESPSDTVWKIQSLQRYLSKPDHQGLCQAPKGSGRSVEMPDGTIQVDYRPDVLASINKCAYGRAKRILEVCPTPLAWTFDLTTVPGIGKPLAAELIDALLPPGMKKLGGEIKKRKRKGAVDPNDPLPYPLK